MKEKIEAHDTFTQYGLKQQTGRNSGGTSGKIQMFAWIAVNIEARPTFTDGWFQRGGMRGGEHEQMKTNRI